MDCDEVKTMLAGYADVELSPLERSAVESHLATCGRCRELVADQQRVRRVIESYAPPPVPDGKWTAMAKRLRAELGGKEHATLKTRSRIDSLDERPDESPTEPQEPARRGAEAAAPPEPTSRVAPLPLRPPSISVLKARPKKRRPRFTVVAHVAGALAASVLVALSLTAVLRPTEFSLGLDALATQADLVVHEIWIMDPGYNVVLYVGDATDVAAIWVEPVEAEDGKENDELREDI